MTTYVKLIRKDKTHYGIVLREGLNCLKSEETFNENPDCGPGGLYFCKDEDAERWLFLYEGNLGFVATVTLCLDSKLVSMSDRHKLKTDRFILGPFQPKETFFSKDRAARLQIQRDGWALLYVLNKTPTICLAAVQHTGCALQYVPEMLKTMTICFAAVQQDGWALQWVPRHLRTMELCIAAVQQDGQALQFVPATFKTAKVYMFNRSSSTVKTKTVTLRKLGRTSRV